MKWTYFICFPLISGSVDLKVSLPRGYRLVVAPQTGPPVKQLSFWGIRHPSLGSNELDSICLESCGTSDPPGERVPLGEPRRRGEGVAGVQQSG